LRPDPGNQLACRTLSDDATRKLAEELAKAGSIEVLELARGLEIRATSFVGRLTLGEVTITVQPKLSGAPFINLLRYAYGLRHLDLYNPVRYSTQKWAFQDLLVQQLAAEVAELAARGLHREYNRTSSDLENPRGRIEFDRLVGMTRWSRAGLPCAHYPRTDDTLLNQTVLAGLTYATRLTNDTDLRTSLTRLIKLLNTTVSIKKLSVSMLDEARQTIDRRTTVYTPVLTIIQLLLEAEGVSLDDEMGRVRLPGFLFHMNRFFQAVISKFLHDHLEGYEIQDERGLKELFYYAPGLNPRKRRRPILRPDFVIWRNQRTEAILDAKYRDLWEKPLPREMLNQVALYALGRGGEERKSIILYPTLASDASEQGVNLCDPRTGDFQAQVILRPVNLLELESLLHNTDRHSIRRRGVLVHQLSFGNRNTA
jgi:5-methylcytosine-specific restriction enzyme subunit McrC